MPTLAEPKIQDESTECGVNVNVLTQRLLQPPLSPVNAMEWAWEFGFWILSVELCCPRW